MKITRWIATALCTTGVAFGQGSLTPPGAPAPTMKTLDELDAAIDGVSNAVEAVEARIDLATVAGDGSYHHTIVEPGSYYLSSNLEVTKDSGISILASGVTLDLNGFEISYISGNSVYGIIIGGGMDRVTIRNGSITGEFDYGIRCYSPVAAKDCLFEKLAVSGCTSYGIYAGTASRIIDCRVQDTVGTGILALAGSSLVGCIVTDNTGGYGIYAGSGSSLVGCTASGGNSGDYSIYTGSGSSLVGCTASGNSNLYGICAGSGSSLSDCTAYNNQGDSGISAWAGSSLTGCSAYNNHVHYGISAGNGTTLRGCSAYSNEGGNSSSCGIYAASGSTVVECTAYNNSSTNSPSAIYQGVGIRVGNGSSVINCTSAANDGCGIYVFSDSVVSGNTCDSNGAGSADAAGIYVRYFDNRIDNNNVTDTDYGIYVYSSGNIIVRNTASGNADDFYIAAGNDAGAEQTTVSAAGPWDNFSF